MGYSHQINNNDKPSYKLGTFPKYLHGFIIIVLLFVTPSVAGETSDVVVDVEHAVQEWILYRCDAGDGDNISISLKELGPKTEAVLMQAAEQGPPSGMMDLLEEQLRDSWQARMYELESEAELGLGPELIELLRRETEDEFYARNKQEFSLGYRQKSIVGLGLVGTETARPLLEKIQREGPDILARAAEEALQSIK